MGRRLAAAGVVVALTTLGLVAQNQLNTYQQLSVGSSPVSIAAATMEPAGQGPIFGCFVRTESASVRYRIDGPAATATVGMPLPINVDPLALSAAQASAASFHGYASSATALVNVTCLR